MPLYRIHIVNRDFRESNESEHPDDASALKGAIRGALAIGTDEVCGGKPFFGADVTVAIDGEIIERRMVAIGSTSLQTPGPTRA